MRVLLVTVKQACILLNIGNTKIYDLIANGLLEKRKIGSKTLVTMRSIEKLAGIPIDDRVIPDTSKKTNLETGPVETRHKYYSDILSSGVKS